jgi:hypothetical protein
VAKRQAGNESEWHVVGVRLRVVGTGDLDMRLSDLDNGQILPMVSITMQAATRIEPTRLANFQSQRVRFEGSTSEIDEYFRISRIIIFAKPVAVEYPM